MILKPLINTQSIKNNVDLAKAQYLDEQKQLPRLKLREMSLRTDLVELSKSAMPLHKACLVANHIKKELAGLELRIEKLSNPRLLEEFEKSSTIGCYFINDSIRKHHCADQSMKPGEQAVQEPPAKKIKPSGWLPTSECIDNADEEEAQEEKLDHEREAATEKMSLHAHLLNLKRLHLVDEELATAASLSAPKPGAMTVKPVCTRCNMPLFCALNQTKAICKNCAHVQDYTDSHTMTLAFSANSDWQTSVYERYTHLLEIIEPFRPRKRAEIPGYVYDQLRALIRQHRDGKRALSFENMQNYLEQLELKDLYKHRYQLIMDFTGKSWPIITEKQELLIIRIFLLMQKSFESIQNAATLFDASKCKRFSFPKYEFVAYHIAKMLGFTHLCPFLKLLQVPGRHRKQLRLLRLILKDLGLLRFYNPQMC